MVDHVIPTQAGLALGIEQSWLEDFCNTVLCCSGCNGFRCRYELPATASNPTDVNGFATLRDAIFVSHKDLILARLMGSESSIAVGRRNNDSYWEERDEV